MPPAPRKRARGHLGRGTLLSLLLHAQVILPLGIAAFVYGGREEARRAEEIDVAFESVPEEALPKDLPPLEPPKDDSALEKLEPDAKKPPPKKKTEREKLAELEKPKPKPKAEPEIIVPPLPPMPQQQPPPPPERKHHEKMVDVENDKDVPPPPDAKFLAEKNNRVDQETRATETNLERNQKGEGVESSPSERQDEQVGSDKAKIAELQDQKSEAGRKAPAVTPHAKPELASEDQRRERSLLALRDPAPRAHEITPETADPSLPHAADGELRTPRPVARGDQARADKAAGKHVKLAITGRDYEYLFGADAEADRRLASKAKSSKLGKFQARQQRAFSALENFIPEVKPGNQTALNTRAAPFAAFVARMHRSIHKLWGFGALEEWDEMPGTSPLNNPNLLTTLEMVLNADGTVDKVTVVRTSGYTAYDLAAIDVAFQAGPYPDPPRAIRSANGKIYVHWRFYRDERQCATSGVDYFILDNPPSDADKASLARAEAAAETGTAPAPAEGPRRLRRGLDDSAHSAKMRQLDAEVARAEGKAETEDLPAPAPARPASQSQDAAARAAAERWFGALAGSDEAALAELSETPFRVTGGQAVRGRSELAPMLKDLAGEVGRHGLGDVQVFSAAGLRGMLGKLPPGLDDGSGLVFGLTTLHDGDTLIVALAKRSGAYRAVALVRR